MPVGLKEARFEYDNIIISDSTLRSQLLPQFLKCRQDTRSCGVADVAYLPKVYIHDNFHGKIVILKTQGSQPKYSKQNVWGEIKSHI